jgi:uncharacterized FlaG/YvyC family protein
MEGPKIQYPPIQLFSFKGKSPQKLDPSVDLKEKMPYHISQIVEKDKSLNVLKNEKLIEKISQRIKEVLKQMDYSIQFLFDKQSKMTIIKILNSEGKVVREIPPSEIRRISSDIERLGGLIFDEIVE